MSTHNIDFYEDLTKLIFQLSSDTHLISYEYTADFMTVKTQFLVEKL